MIQNQLELIGEQTSPLFRIMWINNVDEPLRRHFDNNISAFHIGNGFILSVAHNLKTEAQLFKSIDETIFATEIVPLLNGPQLQFLTTCYPLDPATNKRYLNPVSQSDVNSIVEILKQINFDTRWVTLMQKKSCKPHLIVHFKSNLFYNDSSLTAHFNASTYFEEPNINRHTFLMEVELVEAFYSDDIALYKIVNTPQELINRLPSIGCDFSILNDSQTDYYCLQSSPSGFLGRLVNKAKIEGFLDHHQIFLDRIGGNAIFEGLRYLIQGYFRFGSSGAPYVYYDIATKTFKANAIQSEACPIQLSINNNREGNFQYVNALASPLHLIEERLNAHLAKASV
jgi:hypothetical protein